MTVIPIFSALSSLVSQSPRLRLTVAPQAQARPRFAASDKLGRALSATEALTLLNQAISTNPDLKVVELVGPGDPLATPERTLECAGLIRKNYPEIKIIVTTLGFDVDIWSQGLLDLGVILNLQIDTVTVATAEKIFAWIRPRKKTIPLPRSAPLLIESQAQSLAVCKASQLEFMVSSTVYAGYNDDQIEALAKKVTAFGAKSMRLKSFIPTGGEGEPQKLEEQVFSKIGKRVAKYLPIDRAPEYISLTSTDQTSRTIGLPGSRLVPIAGRPYVAILSGGGMEVDLHLGHARQALIYGPRADGLVCFIESRTLPEPGGGASRWQRLATTLDDCFVLLAASAGPKPQEILEQQGLNVLITEDDIEGLVDALYNGGKKHKCKKHKLLI